jgi:L-serine dehydratase
MQSLKELYKIGNGPSSSHTMGPKKAISIFKEKYKDADRFDIYLYGSLALTGKGHLTDRVITEVLSGYEVNIEFDTKQECKVHPNTFDMIAYKDGNILDKWRVYSIGGGTINIEGQEILNPEEIYKYTTFNEIKRYCDEQKITLQDYVYQTENEDIKEFLYTVWDAMQTSIKQGLNNHEVIPGKLGLKRKANYLYNIKIDGETPEFKQNRIISAYAYAVSEQNASGGVIVTAPTCGSSGVLPAVLYYMKEKEHYSDEEIRDALAVAGLIGNLVKTNASISGAECGCQAEIGTACSMAAAACSSLKKLGLDEIECAAEIAMEHHLGLTCDPIYGYVQIPCIERNAVAATRAIQASDMGMLLSKTAMISFDTVIETMYETGKDLNSHYRETSKGGLAKKYCRNKYYNTEM